MSIMEPEWPPIPITVDGGSEPNLAHLKNPLCAKLDISPLSVVIFKLDLKSRIWSMLTLKKNESIKKYVKEGDLLCAFDGNKLKEFKTIHNNGNMAINSIKRSTTYDFNTTVVSRFEDKYLIEKMKIDKKKTDKKECVKRSLGSTLTTTANNTNNGNKKHKPVEITLSLGGDLNFSDGDDSNSDDDDSSSFLY